MNWFVRLTGFAEESPEQVRANLCLEGTTLTSRVNGCSWICGKLETPSLEELQQGARSVARASGSLSLREVVADVRDLHAEACNAGALFQVASQFNLLEMVSPRVTPEEGVGIYEYDPTQGPASAISAGGGTIYRNYFAPVNGRVGQSADNQIDCLADLGKSLGNEDNRLWEMRNGYSLASREGLVAISERLRAAGAEEVDALRRRLRIGVQWDTQVTLGGGEHLVSQAYCSALPVAYSEHGAERWEDFARLVLEASYEATLCAGILNAAANGSNRVFLTFLGGGAFGNQTPWIVDAIRRALHLYRNAELKVAIVSYGRSNPDVANLVAEFDPPQ